MRRIAASPNVDSGKIKVGCKTILKVNGRK